MELNRPYQMNLNMIDKPSIYAALVPQTALNQSKESYPRNLGMIIDEANKTLIPSGRELSARLHEDSGRIMVSVKDKETGEIIRELPPEEELDTLMKILELAGLLYSRKL